MFVGVHALLAERTDTPELAITEEEGKRFMGACQQVMRHYSVETTQKTLDFVALLGVTTAIYAPRAAAIGIRKRSGPRPAPRQAQRQHNSAPNPAPASPAPFLHAVDMMHSDDSPGF